MTILRTYHHYYFLCIIVLALSSCRKDKVPIPIIEEPLEESCPDCLPIPEGNYGMDDMYILDSIHFSGPQFNPNDDNEIAFVQTGQGVHRVFTFDLTTLEKTLIFEGHLSGVDISWGADNWILLPLMDFQIWKVRPDGTELSQVTSGGSYFHPSFNLSGDRFISYHGYVGLEYYPAVIWDINGNKIDSFNWIPDNGDWKHSSLFGGQHTTKIIAIEPYGKDTVSIFHKDLSNYFDFAWVSDDEALISNLEGIHRYNIYTKEFTKLKCSCESKRYYNATVNNSRTKVIYQRVDLSRYDGSTILEKSTLVIMNPDGTGEELVEIPL